MSRFGVWSVRVVVWTAFGVTVATAGPKAWRTVSAKVRDLRSSAPVATVEVGRVGFGRTPSWLRGELLLAVLEDVAPRLEPKPAAGVSPGAPASGSVDTAGSIGLLDEAAAAALRDRLEQSPWVRSVTLRRRYPDRFVVEVELRRPELELRAPGGEVAVALLDGEGVCLPAAPVAGLPTTTAPAAAAALRIGSGVANTGVGSIGQTHPDATVVAAAAVAHEWRTEMLAEVPKAPALVEVDASNLGYRFLADRRWSEVRVGLACSDGHVAYFGYGHPPGRPSRVAVADKARVLRSILAAFPGLAGLQRGDLRMVNRWRDWLRPRPPDGGAPRGQ